MAAITVSKLSLVPSTKRTSLPCTDAMPGLPLMRSQTKCDIRPGCVVGWVCDLGVVKPHCSMRPCTTRTSSSRIVRRSGQGIQGFSMRVSTRAVGTPNIMRGITSTGERAEITVAWVTTQMSAAMSTALLPMPTTSTFLPRNGSGTR